MPGFEQAHARLTPDGVLELRVGVHSHGQGMETTLAQVAHTRSSASIPDNVRLVHGDTALTPYSTGTWGSRAHGHGRRRGGGGLPAARRTRRAIGAALMQVRRRRVLADGAVRAPDTRLVTIAEVARTWYRAPQNLPPA